MTYAKPTPPDPHSRDGLVQAGTALSLAVQRFPLSKSALFPDLVLFHLALDVLEQTKAALHLTDAGIGRAAIANTRAAFESAIDMLLLTSQAAEYRLFGCLAYAVSLVDSENLQNRRDVADKALGAEPVQRGPTPEAIATEDGAFWELQHPGTKDLLVSAVAKVRSEKLWKRHFSGLSKAQIAERVAAVAPDPAGVKEMIDAMYGLQSFHAHPSPRLSSREVVSLANGDLEIHPLEVDVPAALGFATLSTQLAVIAINRRTVDSFQVK